MGDRDCLLLQLVHGQGVGRDPQRACGGKESVPIPLPLCPLTGFRKHKGFSGKDSSSPCLLDERAYGPRVVAQVWLDRWLPKKREDCGTKGALKPAERPHSWHLHVMDAR